METFVELEGRIAAEHVTSDHNLIVREYASIVENVKQDLKYCETEQTTLRSELEALRVENKNAADVARKCFSQSHLEDCGAHSSEKEMISNLQKQIALIRMEKDSVLQLWQMALKAVDILEEELKSCNKEGNKGTQFYEEQISGVRETYSDAIRALEAKLIQARDNFLKHQSLWETSREKIDVLSKEKEELARKFTAFQEDALERESHTRQTIESLKAELILSRTEVQKTNESRLELEEKLREARKYVATLMAKDDETKSKVSEAIDLVESAVQEKESALSREARLTEEKAKLEIRLNDIAEEYSVYLEKEISRVKEAYERNIKKYLSDMKELKSELRQKETLLDRAQRECRLVEEELEKVRHDSDDFLHKSSSKILDLEQKLKEAELKLQDCEDSCRKKSHGKVQQLEQQVAELEERLVASGERIRRMQTHISREAEERVKEADERTKEIMDRCTNLERRLTRTFDEKETLATEMRSRQSSFEIEMERRDHERRSLEGRIRELQEDLRKASNSVEQTTARGNLLAGQINYLEQEMKRKHGVEKTLNNGECESKLQLTEEFKMLQDKYDKKTRELAQHVEVHQKLSKKWKEEAKALTSSFQKRLKELRLKSTALRKENEELNRELLACRQQLTLYRVQVIHRYDQGDMAR